MLRTRFLAAALLALPLAACEVDNSQVVAGAEKVDELGDVRAALAALPSARVVGQHDDGVPFMLDGKLGSARGQGVASALSSIAPAFRLNASDLVQKRTSVDEQGNTHVRYGQMKNGLPVVNEELIVHIDANGEIYSVNGSARDGKIAPAKARISAAAAKAAALDSTSGRHIAAEGEPRLVYIRDNADLKLAFEVAVTGEGLDMPIHDMVYVSALDGKLIDRQSKIHSAKNRAVYTGNNTTSLPGTLRRSEGGAVTGDAHVDGNYDHLGTTYDCYSVNFARDSYNGAGAQLRSTVHHSTNYTNAFWNGTQMVYGDSDGVQSRPLGLSLDVTVHELTHAVTSSESNLTYSNESGALNEGLSDIFGAYCESWKRGWVVDAAVWMVGDDVWTPNTAGDALRYMANPTQDGSSTDYYPTRYVGASDNGGVHWNSGIANLAFKLLTTGGTHPRGVTTTNVTGIGIQKAGQIFYRANRDLMTASTTFAQAKTYTEQAATALGYTTADVASVSAAWQAVGVGVATPPVPSTALTNGVATTGISGAASSEKHYYLDVTAGRASSFVMSGGTGDADLYVRIGSQPTTTSYNCRPYLSGNNETCNIAAQTTNQRMHVMIRAYSAYSSVSLKGTY
ncbi:M4 family metallopeptidase [Archangium sp.]|uniref:M4 family metallopeptidase n=1 Tax=Archangium sp. TaxID=1872627 RepID=UPI00286D21BB|nr:M4 family metallopeptidase [Archangium sp.]